MFRRKREEDYEDEEEYEEDEEEITRAIKAETTRLIKEMSKCDPTSERYRILSQRVADNTESISNMASTKEANSRAAAQDKQASQAWMNLVVPTVGNIVGNVAGNAVSQMLNRRTVNDVIDFEDRGNIMVSKSTGFIQKPR